MTTTIKITPLRQRMIDDMQARNLGRHSQRSHIYSCKRLAGWLGRSPDTATPDDVRQFQLHLIETGCSIGNRNRIMTGLDDDIKGKDVLIIEDIIDTGNTLHKIKEILSLREPKSIAICSLLDKPTRREVQVPVEWIGFEIPDEFVVGVGIDYAQKYRHLPYIGKVVPQE